MVGEKIEVAPGPSSRVRGRLVKYAVALGMVMVLCWCLVLQLGRAGKGSTSVPARSAADSRERRAAAKLFGQATGLHHERLEAQRKAVRRLAKHKHGEPWLIMLLTAHKMTPSLPVIELQAARQTVVFDLAVTVAALENLPEKPSRPLLWAVSSLLTETQRAQWGEERGFLVVSRGSAFSAPVREIAREYLEKCLGVDHGWDVAAWRKAILEGPERPKDPKPSTRPAR